MAVYTEVTDEELTALIASYGLGELLSYKGIAEGVENTNYVVHTSKGTFILTLYERRVAAHDLPFFLGLLEHLSTRGVSCPLPVRDRNGREPDRDLRARRRDRDLSRRSVGAPATPRALRRRRPGARASCISRAPISPLTRPNALGPVRLACRSSSGSRIAPTRSCRVSAALIGDELAYLDAHWPQGPGRGRHPRRPLSR